LPDDPFAPPGEGHSGELLLDRPDPPARPEAPPPPEDDPAAPAPVEKPAPREPVSLRERPLLRFGLALGLGLGAGYLATLPYTARVERRVAATRADADRLRRDPDKRDLAPAFDARAEREQEESGTTSMVILLGVAAAAAAGWIWITRE
jgi:hypothetical protein